MDKGFSEKVATRISEPQSQATRDSYQGKWKIFSEYCTERDIDPLISEFLSYLFDTKNMMLSTHRNRRGPQTPTRV